MIGHLGSPDPSTRIVNPGDNYPKEIEVRVGDEIKKFPVAYLEKAVLRIGTFTHPKTKEVFTITPAILEDLERKANEMISLGIEIPTPLDHKDEQIARKKNPYFVSSKDNLGFVVKASREGDYLKFIQAAIGEDAALTAIRNRSSVYIKPFTDSSGRDWGSVIVHSAYTPIPAMDGLKHPVSLAREDGTLILELSREDVVMLSEAQKKRLIAIAIIMGMSKADAEKADEATLQAKGVEYLEKNMVEDNGVVVDPKTLKSELDTKTNELKAKTQELTTVQSRESELKLQLSKENSDAPKPREVMRATNSANGLIDGCVASKKFSPATGDLIKAKIKSEPLNLLLARSEEDDKPELFETLIEVATMAASSPVPGVKKKEELKETKLSREAIPADKSEDDDEKPTESVRLSKSAKAAGEAFAKRRRAPVLSGKLTGGDGDK